MARVVLSLALLLGGCASASRVDPQSIEQLVPNAVWPSAPELVADVRCPVEIERGIGTEVACSLTFAGTPAEAIVTQVTDAGSVAIDFAPTVLEAAELAEDVADRLSADLDLDVTVRCDDPFPAQLLEVGATYVCTATDPQERPLRFVAELIDPEGTFTLELLDPE